MTQRARSRGPRGLSLIPVLSRQAWVVLGGDFLSAVGSGLTLPCLFIYAHRVRGLGDAAAGLVVSMVALASLAGNPLGGWLADRWTPRRGLMGGLVVAAAGSAALAVARTSLGLFAAAGLLGLGVAMIWPAQDALLASVVRPADRSAVFSVRHACLNAGLGIGALTAAALISISHPATFAVVYLADAGSYLAFLIVLARLRPAALAEDPSERTGHQQANADRPSAASEPPPPARPPVRMRQILRDSAFVRVWLLTALLVAVSFGQFQSSFAGFVTRPGGVGAHGLALAIAANTLTVVIAQLLVLRGLAGRRRTVGMALAAVAWAVCWAVVAGAGRLGGNAAEAAFAAAMVVFALGECLLSPTVAPIINDLAPAGAAGRYNGLGVLAFTTGFLIGPVVGGAALGAGWGASLFVALAAACVVAAGAALWLGRHLPVAANSIPSGSAQPTQSGAPVAEPAVGGLV